MIRIGVDMAATAGQKSGLGFYVENVVSAMETLAQKEGVEIVRIEKVTEQLRTPQRILWDQVQLPRAAAKAKVDVLFMPAFSAPKFKKPVVMTAHDIYGVHFPERLSKTARAYWGSLIPKSMQRADHLVCVSEYTKKDIAAQLNVPESKMTVTPLAAAEQFKPMASADYVPVLKNLGLQNKYIFTIGTIEPRKNFERLIEAFVHANRDDVHLVIAGKKGWEYEGVFEKIRKYHLEKTVHILDYVTDEQLVALYNGCLFFVMPSLFEGFGLPALEAMKCGAPVAVSQSTSLPEVVGRSGVFFDPRNVEEMRERMNLLLQDAQLRDTLSQYSLKRATEFSWEKTAQKTIDAIKTVV